jgi:hypothetical protein
VTIADTIDDIIRIIDGIFSFWSADAPGWAPREASELLEKARLDRQASLARMLRHWADDFQDDEMEGALILAWANLGALIEGSMKWFLCVHATSYECDPVVLESGRQLEPEGLFFGRMCRFFEEHVWMPGQVEQWRDWINMVRERRNAIHAYQDRPIGTFKEFHAAVIGFREFLITLDGQVPYPDAEYLY